MGLPGNIIAGEMLSMDDKLQQCEMAFNKAHSGKTSQAGASEARSKHRVLMLEILEELNIRNADISTKSGDVMSNKDIVNNLKVMGRMLEMLAIMHKSSEVKFELIEKKPAENNVYKK